MGGGGGGDTYQSNIPKWAAGAHKNLIKEAEQEAYGREFPVYEDPRIAGFSPYEQAAMGARQQMFEQGDPLGAFAADQVTAPGYQASEFDFGTFNDGAMEQYMSPYMQNVVETEKRAALDEYARQGMRSDAERISSGARGGYREAVEQALGGSQQARVMGEIQARGSQAAFENAQQQFERDRGAAIQAAQMGDSSALAAAKHRMSQAAAASDIATTGQARAQERIKDLERAGASQREMEQSRLDLAYEDFMREFQYPKTQMNWLSGMLTGVPSGMMQHTRSPTPGLASQALGLGIGAAGLQRLFSGE